jgi:putative acetyltransferase
VRCQTDGVDCGFGHARCADGRVTLVATDDRDAPLAYGDLEAGGHIDHLYCAPEAAGTGAASAICDALVRTAGEQGVSRIYTEASEGARRFFERQGSSTRERRDFALRGVTIHNYSMEKTLAARPRPEPCNRSE